jgi:hypothetical protein
LKYIELDHGFRAEKKRLACSWRRSS